MTIKRNPLDPYGVLTEAINEVGDSQEAARITGRSKNHIDKAIVPPPPGAKGDRFLSYQDIRNLVGAGAMAPLRDLAFLAGAQLIPVKTAVPVATCIHTGLASIAKEAGEAMATIAEALMDGNITPNEAADMCQSILEMQSAGTAMLQKLQSYMRKGG